MQIFKKIKVSIAFSTKLIIISLASNGSATRTRLEMHISEIFYFRNPSSLKSKSKSFKKSQNFLQNFQKHY